MSDIETSGINKECIVTVRGKDDVMYIAAWENDGYWYLLKIYEEVGMSVSPEDMKTIVSQIK